MKLAFLGAANSPHTIKWANAMAKRGYDVSLYSMPDQKQDQGEIYDSVKIEYLPFTSAQNGAKKNASAVAAALSSGGYNAVVALDMGSYGFMAAKAKAANLLLVSTGLDIYRDIKDRKGMILKAIKQAAVVLATAPNIISKIKEYYKKEKEYCVAPFGVDTDLFKKSGEPRGEKPCFGSVKALEYINNVDAVIEAFAKYVEKHGEAKLLVVGSGPLESDLKNKAASLNVGNMVEFTGYVKNADMPAIYAKLDALVQMTAEECFGVSAIEAMACEVPVVASDTFGASEYILNHITGYLVKAGNTSACADMMADAVKNPQARKKMGELAREDILQSYKLEDCAAKFEGALRKAGARVV